MIASSILEDAARTEEDATMPPSETVATSVVPPPMSMIKLPRGAPILMFAPIAAAIGASISVTLRAPALPAASSKARRSTPVSPSGTQTATFGRLRKIGPVTLRMNLPSMATVTSKSAITPSLIGRNASCSPAVLPTISPAASPTSSTCMERLLTAATDGSWSTMPFPAR